MAETKQKRRYQSRSQLETGIVSAMRLAPTARVRVTFPDRQNLQSWWLRVSRMNSQNNKDFWMPDLGEQVDCLMDEQFRNGVVIGSSDNAVDTIPAGMTLDKRHTTFKDGATLEYDRALHVLEHLAQDGALFKYDATAHAFSAAIPSGATFTITAGPVTVSIDASGNVNLKPSSADVNLQTSEFTTSLNAFFNLFNSHVHSGVQSGSSDTAPPTATVP